MKKQPKELKTTKFLKKPEYPGGIEAMRLFINQNMKYPTQAIENKTEGAVILSFDIDYNGTVSEAKVMHGIGNGCDEEALRLVNLMVFSKAINRGVKVKTTRRLRIDFKLNTKTADVGFVNKQQVQQIQQMVYTYTPKPKIQTPVESPKPPQSKTYTYTISW